MLGIYIIDDAIEYIGEFLSAELLGNFIPGFIEYSKS